MRIALVHLRHRHTGGIEQIINRLASHLADRSHDVTIVCRSHERPPHPAVRFQVLRRFAPGTAARMWLFAHDVARHIPRAGYDVTMGLGKTWTHDVIRTGAGSQQTYLQMVSEHHAGKQGLLGRRRLKDHLALRIEQRAYAPGAYHKVIANSQMVRRDLQARYAVPDERIELIYNGIDLDRFHPCVRPRGQVLRRELGLEPQHFILLFLGVGFRRKGLARLLRAMPDVRAKRGDVRLLVVGDDATRQAHERLADRLGLRDTVHFLGRRHDPEVCYAAADLLVLPSWYDSFGFAVLEAMASAIPVITTDQTGAAELVEPATGSVLPGSCDAETIADALYQWCDRDRTQNAQAPARAVAEHYGFENTTAQMANVLTAIAPGPGSKRKHS